MFLPLNDDNTTRRWYRPIATWSIIATCSLIYIIFQSGLVFNLSEQMVVAYGLIPSVFMGNNTIASDVFHVPAVVTPLTYMFLHGHWMHLIGNMMFLWVFGDNVEAEMGRLRFLLFYLSAGAAAGIMFALCVPESNAPLVGASGSVAAILGAYLVLHPQVRILALAFNVIPVRIPAFWMILGWFFFQIGHALFDTNQQVAWVAHVVGLIIGASGVVLMRLPRGRLNLRRLGDFARRWR